MWRYSIHPSIRMIDYLLGCCLRQGRIGPHGGSKVPLAGKVAANVKKLKIVTTLSDTSRQGILLRGILRLQTRIGLIPNGQFE